MLFPVKPVERLNGHLFKLALIHAAYIHALTMWVRSRHVKGLDTTMPAKGVLSNARIESVGRQHVFARKQTKVLKRHYQMDKSDDGTDGAVAVQERHPGRGVNFELNGAAVARALVGIQGLTQGQFPKSQPLPAW